MDTKKIKDLVAKLNTIDAKDIKIFIERIRDTDPGRIKEELFNRPELVINTLCIVIACFVALRCRH